MTIVGWIFVVGLWVLFFWLYRDYRLDLFRFKLFVLRDELFDLASRGEVSFDSTAYGMMRDIINGNIRFGHRLGFLDGLCLVAFTGSDELQKREVERYIAKWEKAIADLDPKARKAVERIRLRLHFRMVEQIIFTSALLVFTLVTLVCWMILTWLKDTIIQIVARLISGPKMRRVFEIYDCSAALR